MLGSVPYTLTLLKIQLLATVCSAENTVEVDNEEGGTIYMTDCTKMVYEKKRTPYTKVQGSNTYTMLNFEPWCVTHFNPYV